jgi:hypothetical protein
MTSTRRQRRNHHHSGTPAAESDAVPCDPFAANGLPGGGNGDFIDLTVAVWQKQTTRQLSREDGREIIENMTGFFRILQEWDRAERTAKSTTKRVPVARTNNASGPADRRDSNPSHMVLSHSR